MKTRTQELESLAATIAAFTTPGKDPQDDADTLRSLIREARRILRRRNGGGA